jgi:hypothetical protein
LLTGISSSLVTQIGQLEQHHHDLVPLIASSSLSVSGLIPRVGRPPIRDICQTTVAFHPQLCPSPALRRRASDTTSSALEGVGPKLLPSAEHRNPAAGHGIAQFAFPCSPNIFHRGLGTHPFED